MQLTAPACKPISWQARARRQPQFSHAQSILCSGVRIVEKFVYVYSLHVLQIFPQLVMRTKSGRGPSGMSKVGIRGCQRAAAEARGYWLA